MKRILHLLIGLIFCVSASAQVYTLNWSSAFAGGWVNGATSATAFNIGGSGINCSVSLAKTGGAYSLSAPTVSNSVVVVPGSSNNLMVALDYSTSSQYTDITFTFTGAAYNLSFYLADIDRLTNSSNSYFDEITITGKIGTSTILPVLTKYDAVTDPNFLIISSNVAKVNSANGMAGNSNSDATDQKGTIKVDFNGHSITSFTIRYANSVGVAADPGIQFIGIGNISFRPNFPLAVQLVSFDGENKNGKNTVRWNTVNESEMAYYAVERSEDAKEFTEVGRVNSRHSATDEEYGFTDDISNAGQYCYRLKMVNTDGSFTYSKTVLVNQKNTAQASAYPSVFTSSLNIRVSSQKEESLGYELVDLSGKPVHKGIYKASKGMNEFTMQPPAGLPRGQYFIVMGNNRQPIRVMKQ